MFNLSTSARYNSTDTKDYFLITSSIKSKLVGAFKKLIKNEEIKVLPSCRRKNLADLISSGSLKKYFCNIAEKSSTYCPGSLFFSFYGWKHLGIILPYNKSNKWKELGSLLISSKK